MATVLRIVSDAGATLFDFNNSAGTGNPGSAMTFLGLGGAFNLSAAPTEVGFFSPPNAPGGSAISVREPLARSSFRLRMQASSYDNLSTAVNELARLLKLGGTMSYTPNGSSVPLYIDYLPSPTPVLFEGKAMEVHHATTLFDTPEGVTISFTRQPYLRGVELDPAVNIAVNPTMTLDSNADGRPDSWAWDSTTNLSAEAIDAATESYSLSMATDGARWLQQTTPAASVGNAETWTFSFYVKASATNAAVMPAFQPLVAAGTDNGSAITGTLTDITTSWQRLSVSGATPATLTDKAELQLRFLNDSATAVTVYLKNAQFEEAASASTFRVGPQSVSMDPAGSGRILPVWVAGSAPVNGKVRATMDSGATVVDSIMARKASYGTVGNGYLTDYANRHALQAEDATLDGGVVVTDSNASGGEYAETWPIRQSVSDDNGTQSQSVSCTWAETTKAGSTLIAVVTTEKIGTDQVDITLSGWTSVRKQNQGGGAVQSPTVELFKKTNAAAESGAVTATLDDGVSGNYYATMHLLELTGGGDIDTSTSSTGGSDTSPTIAQLTATAVDTFQIGFLAADGSPTMTSPTNNLQATGDAGVTTGVKTQMYYQLRRASGLGGGGDVTLGTAGYYTVMSVGVFIPQNTYNEARRFRSNITTKLDSLRVPLDVYLRLRPLLAASYDLQLKWGLSTSIATFAEDAVRVDFSGATSLTPYTEVYLGTIYPPEDQTLSAIGLEVWSTNRTTPTVNFELSPALAYDCLILVPNERGAHVKPASAGPDSVTLGADLTTPVASPGSGSAGTVSGTSLLFSSGDNAGIGPNGGTLLLAGRHTFTARLRSVTGSAQTATVAVRNVTSASDAVSQAVTIPAGAGGKVYYGTVSFTADGTSKYQGQVRGGVFYVDQLAHSITGVVEQNESIRTDPSSPPTANVHASDASVRTPAEVEGPVPIVLEPGLNLLYVAAFDGVPNGYPEGESTLTRTPTVQVTYAPRYYA